MNEVLTYAFAPNIDILMLQTRRSGMVLYGNPREAVVLLLWKLSCLVLIVLTWRVFKCRPHGEGTGRGECERLLNFVQI